MNFLTITCKNRFKKAAGSPWAVVINRHFVTHYDPRASQFPTVPRARLVHEVWPIS